MNKQYRFVVIVITSVIAASLLYLFFTRSSSTPYSSSSTVETDEKVKPVPVPAQSPANGTYLPYAADTFAASKDTRLLFFHAPWCPQCRALERSIQDKGVPSGVTIFKIDYDSNQALRQKYGVTIQTTVVKVDGEGSRADSFVAYDEPTIMAVERALMP